MSLKTRRNPRNWSVWRQVCSYLKRACVYMQGLNVKPLGFWLENILRNAPHNPSRIVLFMSATHFRDTFHSIVPSKPVRKKNVYRCYMVNFCNYKVSAFAKHRRHVCLICGNSNGMSDKLVITNQAYSIMTRIWGIIGRSIYNLKI